MPVINPISTVVGVGNIPHSRALKKKRISFEQLFNELQEKGFKDVKKVFNANNPRIKQIYVDWGHAIVSEPKIALGTDGISSCSALKIIDPTTENLQYMLHAYPETEPKDIAKSLRKARSLGMNLQDSKIEIMPGNCLTSESTPHILEALYKINPSLIDIVTLIHDMVIDRIGSNQALVAFKGNTYRYPESPNFKLPQISPNLNNDGLQMVLMS